MNAPWRPGGPRDMFQAFACDETSVGLIRAVAVEMGWMPERVVMGGLHSAVQTLAVSASPHILFIDLSDSQEPLNEINNLAEVCEPGTIVIATGQINDVRFYRELLASGIQDYLLKPLNPDQLRDALFNAQAMFMAPRSEGSEAPPHVAVAVIGTRGGVGTSTFATSLGWLLSDKLNRSVAMLDLDLYFGTTALTLDLEPGRGLLDAIDNPSRIDGLFIERAMVRASERLAVLSAEAPINQPMLTDGGTFYQLQEEFRTVFDCSIIDLPRHMMIQHPQLMAGTNVTVLVTELTLAAARDTIRMLSWLKTNAPHCQVVIVANKVQVNNLEISRKDFEQSIERAIDILLPFDPRQAAQSAKLGKPLAEIARGGKLGALYAQASQMVLAAGDDTMSANDAAASGTSLLGKIGNLKSLLNRRKAEVPAG